MTIPKQQLINEIQQLCSKHGYYYSISTGRINLMHVPDVPESEAICNTICEVLNVKLSELRGEKRTREICDARFIMYAIIRELYPSYTLRELGRTTGGRDHSSIVNALKKHSWDVVHHEPYRLKYESVKSELQQKGIVNVYNLAINQ